jgi:hypothetical protein
VSIFKKTNCSFPGEFVGIFHLMGQSSPIRPQSLTELKELLAPKKSLTFQMIQTNLFFHKHKSIASIQTALATRTKRLINSLESGLTKRTASLYSIAKSIDIKTLVISFMTILCICCDKQKL